MIGYYDRDGNPLTQAQWIDLFDNYEYQMVAVDEIDGVRVSTVWLGLDHQYGEGPPLIFETMIIGGARDGDLWRYPTEADALAGHRRTTEAVMNEG